MTQTAREPFGWVPHGAKVERLRLSGGGGLQISAISLGAILQQVLVPDRDRRLTDVVLGFDDLDPYLNRSPYFGAVIGRYANRIANGKFELEGRTYKLARNEGANCLHGGSKGFDKAVWNVKDAGLSSVTFTHDSPDGDQGFPGNLHAVVRYTVTADNALVVDYEATSDAATVINLTQHSYWNLRGAGEDDILDHELQINASHYTPVDTTLTPVGRIAPVEGTPFDFRSPARVGSRIHALDEQLAIGGGYDHNFVLDTSVDDTSVKDRPREDTSREGSSQDDTSAGDTSGEPRFAARLVDPRSGRALTVHTTELGLQLYTGNRLDGTIRCKGQKTYGRYAALCLETQHFPDSPNKPDFPSTVLKPGQTYRSRTIFAFGVT